MQKRLLREGFTLVELLLAIAIMGVLAAIVVTYTDGDERRTEIGAPCALQDDILEITPYLRTNHSTVPEDYKNRNKKIPLKQIVRYARVDIAHLI